MTHVFTSLGTCGTVTGLATFLKAKRPAVKVMAVQPSRDTTCPGIRNVSELDVSKLFDPKLIDEMLEIDFELAYSRAARSGACRGPVRPDPARASSSRGAAGAEREKVGCGVLIFCDNVFKYASNMVKHLPELSGRTNRRRPTTVPLPESSSASVDVPSESPGTLMSTPLTKESRPMAEYAHPEGARSPSTG